MNVIGYFLHVTIGHNFIPKRFSHASFSDFKKVCLMKIGVLYEWPVVTGTTDKEFSLFKGSFAS
jgi:hypothetical protein